MSKWAVRLRYSAILVRGEWIRMGRRIAYAGEVIPHGSDLHSDVYGHADRWVAGLIDKCLKAGDIAGAIEQGAIRERTLRASLGEIVAGREAGRVSDMQISEAVGTWWSRRFAVPVNFCRS